MNRKKYIKRALKIISLLLVVVLCTALLQEYLLCHSDHNRERIKGFYLEDRDSLDVVIIGASEVYSGFSSVYAYKRFGFTSYPFATQSNIISSYKSQLKEVIDRQHPRLIVIEINGALYRSEKRFLDNEANFRNYIDNIPMNMNKISTIQDYAPSEPLEYYLPIVKFHSVWNDFPAGLKWNLSIINDQLRGYNLLKGVKNKTNVYKPKEKFYNNSVKNNNEREKLSPRSEEYLRDLLEYCRSEDLNNVVFARFPHVLIGQSMPRFKRSNTAGDIIKEYGYDYLNCEKNFDETGLDVNVDFYNSDHMNIYGQQKFTEYFGKLLTDRYGITKSDLNNAQKEKWDKCVRYYDAYYKYSDTMIKDGNNKKDIDENCDNMQEIEKYL